MSDPIPFPGAMEPISGLTEDNVAQRFADLYRGRLAFDHDQGKWLEYDGSIWRVLKTPLAFHYARQLCRQLSGRNPGSPAQFQKVRFAAGVERFAQADPVFARTSEHWNPDPFLLGTPQGTVDLTTGRLRHSSPTDNISCAVAVAPAEKADCPLWREFLRQAAADDPELIRFLQQIAGYALTGDTREHALFFIYGPGGNGKSVFLNVITKILGDYARVAAMSTFERQRGGGIPSDIATLAPARLVTSSETEEGQPWAQARVQQMTGGDPLTARFMRQNEFTYLPRFKLVIIGNHKPVLKSVDDAIRRRFNIVPFLVKPAEPDLELETKLVAEWPAILRWAINGCLDWQMNGLARPHVVVTATAEYFLEQDTLQQWLDQECDVDRQNPFYSASATSLFKSWSTFLASFGEEKQTMKAFAATLTKAGFPKQVTRYGKFYQCLKLRENVLSGDGL